MYISLSFVKSFIHWIHLQCRRPRFNSWVGKIPWKRERLLTPIFLGLPGSLDSKESACNVGDLSLIPGSGKSPGGMHGNPLQYSCLENPMDRGAWRTIVHGVAKSWTGLKGLSKHAHISANWTYFPFVTPASKYMISLGDTGLDIMQLFFCWFSVTRWLHYKLGDSVFVIPSPLILLLLKH